ncbi:MAG: AbrB/MazE/SpoVT family DNA-binding domain-containing protein [Eggerthellaceae bacterium]|nr:AbrB/MazE/SpoVT family DNA-binding domain-containing protein [Eggerthellaceae bacterium]MBQ9069557.1 AbrB/MazE/SpoVT family DNA-binding domain-containing protein [Eggerthellaceae bacterium]
MATVLDMAKVTSKGQVTVPQSVRNAIDVHEGDKILFVQEDDGRVSLYGSNMQVLKAAQDAFAGAAEEAGLETIDDVVALVNEVRSEGVA